ncbi:MAG TPA: MBL fold metallo-hydrolase [Rhodopirellula baltica]|uniref:PhnP protein homolog-putative hydrolase n=1 Tax=Rhodopirellula baltica (strain DSM 10527 / NCIMB 13988 / SH1) TaxID=243090 RepID=Q7UJJ2_RHOBA|nr:MBL fold metallo-hydrolase [Rhodopirellula baltica]CAD77266.1 phnP protein homolog-putative hydrolase [Rhodopirellula baltica SH 1]HBE62842.1 MBL fold metallo-hydrolase [Rhodopirellula baltica]
MTASDPAPADSSATNPTSPAPTPEVIFLGTGTSVGVPAIGCECDVCQSTDPHNNRTRCSILIRLPEGNLLIDTPPDLRTQLLREKVKLVHAVLFTHEHADHIYGLDDLRLFPFRLGRPVPLYCRADVEARIRTSYDYAFSQREQTHAGSRPQLEILSINNDDPFEVLGVRVTPVPLKHGPHFEVLGFRMGDFAYCTDTNHISETSMDRLRGLDTLVLDALRFTPHPTHFNIDEALEVIEELKPRQAFLTHLGHDIDHGPVEASLPDHVHLAYDGLRLPMPSIA